MKKIEASTIMQDPRYIKEREKYNLLRASLSKVITERDHLIITVKKNLEALYIVKIGKNEYKLFELQCLDARLRRKIELMQAMKNKAEDIDLQEIEKKLDEEYAAWQRDIGKLIKKWKNSKERLDNLMSDKESAAFQKLYRDLVKRLHPDININQSEYEKSLWNRLMAAYLSGDFEEMQTIEILLENEKKRDESNFQSIEMIKTAIKKIKEKIKSVIAEIKKANQVFPLNIKDQIKDEDWVKQKNKKIHDEAVKIEQHIKDLKSVIDTFIIEAINEKLIKSDGKGLLRG
jgi:hypothetical protein